MQPLYRRILKYTVTNCKLTDVHNNRHQVIAIGDITLWPGDSAKKIFCLIHRIHVFSNVILEILSLVQYLAKSIAQVQPHTVIRSMRNILS